jgi:hypothetical protein
MRKNGTAIAVVLLVAMFMMSIMVVPQPLRER